MTNTTEKTQRCRTGTRNNRVAVIGAGPVGLEAAWLARVAGFDVHLFERGEEVAANLADWGHVRLFSPFGWNSSVEGRRAVQRHIASPLPADETLLTGHEFAARYLRPLSRLPELAGRIHTGCEVISIGRDGLLKGEHIGTPQRAEHPFRLLLRGREGEREHFADYVFDCSGVYPRHNFIGPGGCPSLGETEFLQEQHYRLPDIAGKERARFAGRRTLVIGSGFSAATAIVSLAELAAEEAGTSVLWLTRTARRPPLTVIANDQLAERDRLAKRANALALSADSPVQWRPSSVVRAVRRAASANRENGSPAGWEVVVADRSAVSAEGMFFSADENRGEAADESCPGDSIPGGMSGGSGETVQVDEIIAQVGYRPDRTLYEELQVHECYATQGPIKLAAALLGETSPDCLAPSSHGAETLCLPEPGFFILGAKSYGRDSRFLLRTGLQQIREVLQMLSPGGKPAGTNTTGSPARPVLGQPAAGISRPS